MNAQIPAHPLEVTKPEIPSVANFLAIASDAACRGFLVTPVIPGTKRAFLPNFQHYPSKDLNQIEKWARLYPNYSVGIVTKTFWQASKSEPGEYGLCILDNDAEGVIEQIQEETGYSLPLTYIVQGRPDSAPWKRHVYFIHTPYSIKHLPKTKDGRNAKNIGAVETCGRYDLKTRDSIVIGAGSIHEKTGRPYVIEQDAPVVPVPAWFVDWVVMDYHRCKARLLGEKALLAESKAESSEPSEASPDIPSELWTPTLDDEGRVVITPGQLVPEGHRWGVLRSVAGTLAKRGYPPKARLISLIAFAKERFMDGEDYVKDGTESRRKLESIAYSDSLVMGNIWLTKEQQSLAAERDAQAAPPPPSRHCLLVKALVTLQGFTSNILVDKGYHFLSHELNLANHQYGTAYKLDRKEPADQVAVCKARKEAGWTVERIEGERYWIYHTVATPSSGAITNNQYKDSTQVSKDSGGTAYALGGQP